MSASENKPKKAWKRMTCVRCPHCNQKSGWCAVTARWVSPLAPCCDYGARTIRAGQNLEAQRRHHGKAADGSDLKRRVKRHALKVETKLVEREDFAAAMTRHLRASCGFIGAANVPRNSRRAKK